MSECKEDSVGDGASGYYVNRGLSLYDKYVLLQAENQKLRRALRKLGEAFHYWKELALQYQADRDIIKEDLQELAQARRGDQ